jgi:SulP family sulfate permease
MTSDRLIPALSWARRYRRGDLAADLLAAVVVTIMLIPQGMAYAMLAGLPPQAGLYASILPLVGYAVFGSSRALAVGPVAVVSLMTFAAVRGIAEPGSPEFVAAAITLALLSGAFLIAIGVFRLGFLAQMLSHPVLSGFITAAGIVIAVSQFRHVLGVKAQGETLFQMLAALFAQAGAVHSPTVAIGLLTILFLLWARRSLKPLLVRAGLGGTPADLLAKSALMAAVAVSTVVVALFQLDARGVKVVGEIPRGLPPLALPPLDPSLWLALLPAAALIGIVGFVESISVAQTLAARRRQRVEPDQELIGLGVANLCAAVSGAYPVTGGISRSVVNFDAGAVTPMAGVLTAIGIAATTLVLTPLFYYLPQAVLAAIVIVAVQSVIDIKGLKRIWTYSKSDFAASAVTILTVLGVGVEPGIVAGVVASLVLFLWRTSRPHMAVVGQVPRTEHFRNILRHRVITSETVLSIRVDESLYFANARYLEDRIYALIAERPALRHVVLMCPAINFIDASALESLETINDRLRTAGVTFHLSEVKGPVMDALQRSDFFEHFSGAVFLSQHAAMQALDPAATRLADERQPPGCRGAAPSPTILGEEPEARTPAAIRR